MNFGPKTLFSRPFCNLEDSMAALLRHWHWWCGEEYIQPNSNLHQAPAGGWCNDGVMKVMFQHMHTLADLASPPTRH
jgi:hypothetical protein